MDTHIREDARTAWSQSHLERMRSLSILYCTRSIRPGTHAVASLAHASHSGVTSIASSPKPGTLLVTRTPPRGRHQLYQSRCTLPLSRPFASLLSTTNAVMASLTPPQPPPSWTHSAEQVLEFTKDAIAKDRELKDRVAALPSADCNFTSVCVHYLLNACILLTRLRCTCRSRGKVRQHHRAG